MPINPLVLQRRHAEIGRIRLGEQQEFSRRDGSTGTKPVKLTTFRMTSPSQDLIRSVAELYNGTVEPWDNNGKPEWQVTTDAKAIPVIVVKGGLSQWMEYWSGGGCIHRCDGTGDLNVITGDPCDLSEKVRVGKAVVNPHAEAKPTTRLSVMLRDVETLGVWRLETHGWNAAAEIPAIAELAQYVGDLVPAILHLVERRSVRDGQTSRFVVPVLDLAVSKARLVELVAAQSGTPLEIATATTAPAIEAGPSQSAPPPAPIPWRDILAGTTTQDECAALWRQLGEAGQLDEAAKGEITVRVRELQAGAKRQADAPAEAPEPVAATAVDPPLQDLWFRLLEAAGNAGLTDPQMRERFRAEFGTPIEQSTPEQAAAFLAQLTAPQPEPFAPFVEGASDDEPPF